MSSVGSAKQTAIKATIITAEQTAIKATIITAEQSTKCAAYYIANVKAIHST
jgi:hypothetical protein